MNANPDDEFTLGIDLPVWTEIQTEGWLTEYPLPADFTWTDRYGTERPVLPKYRISGGYGKWLHETPYFPGLFEHIHEIIARAPAEQELTPEWIVEKLAAYRSRSTQQPLL